MFKKFETALVSVFCYLYFGTHNPDTAMIKFVSKNQRLYFLYFLHTFLPLSLVLILLSGCKKTETDESAATDTTAAVADDAGSVASEGEGEEEMGDDKGPAALWPKDIFSYKGIVNDDAKKGLENFPALTTVLEAAARSVAIKDSLEMLPRERAEGADSYELTDPEDSAVFRPLEIKAWQAIQAYKTQLADGIKLTDQCPSLLDLIRETDDRDKSASYLPAAGKSNYLTHGKFFFLGGYPFISEISTEDGTPFTDARGNPERRFSSSMTENGMYMLNSLYHFQNIKTAITYGAPLRSYDMGPQEVNGVGSLIHTFQDPYYVFFLTEDGVVQARLISAEVKLVPENLGCVSDQPEFIFACSKNIHYTDILAIYIPYHSEPVTEFKLVRHAAGVWTADVNEDGMADLACVSGSFEGISSDAMAEVMWFVNINGVWKILDFAAELDCT